jgi:hypothetical protein
MGSFTIFGRSDEERPLFKAVNRLGEAEENRTDTIPHKRESNFICII